MSTAQATTAQDRRQLLTIGTVCRRLQTEFPDISISKIRYLEDQGLLLPKRTQGGYRLFGEDDVERLETILRLQRDEFLPLRVIRQELASPSSSKTKRRKRAAGLTGPEEELDARDLAERSGATPQLLRELEVSYRRRILHGKIDLLRAELQARLRETGGKSVLEQVDVERLAAILAGKAAPPAE